MSKAVHEEAWATRPLIEVATLQRGYDLPVQDRTEGPHPIFAANGPVGFHGSPKCKGPGVVTGRSGTIGKVHFVESDYWPLNTSLFVKDFHGNDPKWVYHLLQQFGLERFAQGAGVPTLNRNLIHGEPIKVPPLPEQRRISAILDKADALFTRRLEVVKKLDLLTRSIFVEMFGDPVTNTKGWPTKKLASLTSKMGSGATPTGGDAAYKDSGISLIRSMNVHDGRFVRKNLAFIDNEQADKLRNVVVEEGDVLLNITGASVARVCRAPSDVLPARVNQHVMILRPSSGLNSVFLENLLLNPSMKARLLKISGAGATREAITKYDTEELNVITPPESAQTEFERRIRKVFDLKNLSESALSDGHALYASLQNRAFRGEL